MGTSGGIDRTGASATLQSFWHSDAGANLPNGVTDVTEDISRTGNTAIGDVPAATPVAKLDVADGGRSGTDGRTPATPAYITGALPPMPVFNNAGLTTPVGGAEVRHSNQSQGIGFAHNGLYATGASGVQEFGILNRGNGIHWKGWQALNAIDDNYIGAAFTAAGQFIMERFYAGGGHVGNWYKALCESVGPLSTRMQWDIISGLGGLVAGMMLRPANDGARNTHNTELSVGGNQVHKRKLVLHDNGAGLHSFYGLGIEAGTLVHNVPDLNHVHRFEFGADDGVSFDTNGVVVHRNPPAVAATDEPLYRNPATGRVTRGAPSPLRHSFAGTGVTDAAGNVTFNFVPPFPVAPVVSPALGPTANVNLTEARIVSVNANSCVVNVRQVAGINVALLGLTLLGLPTPAPGVTVQLIAQTPGRFVP